MMRKYKILIATPFLSDKPIRGYENIVLSIVEDLFENKHDVDIITFDSEGNRILSNTLFKKYFNKILIIRVNKFQRFINLFIGLLTGQSIQVSYFSGNQSDEKQVLRHIQYENYDLVISITVRMARFLTYVNSNAYKVIHLVDPHVLNYSRSMAWENFYMRFIYWIDYPRLLKFERNVLQKFQLRTLISDEDINEMALVYDQKFEKLTYGSRNVSELTNFLDFDKRDKDKMVITGNMSYKPNVVGIEWFCNYVFPLLLKNHPTLNLYLIGQNPSKQLLKLQSKNIILTGYITNLSSFMENAIVSICPINHRIGVQTKILEAFSQKLPVIATSNSNSGINASVGKEILIADTPEEFLMQYEYILKKENWQKLSKNGFDLFKNHFDLTTNMRKMNSIIFKKIDEFKSL